MQHFSKHIGKLVCRHREKLCNLEYAKTLFEAFNKENEKATFYFQFENQEQIDTINEYLEEFNENLDKNNVYTSLADIKELEDGTKCIIFNSIPKKHLVKSRMPEKYRDKL